MKAHHRKHGGSRRKLFWYRQTGNLNSNNGTPIGAMTIFDVLQFLPDPVNQRADVNDDITIMHVRFNWVSQLSVTTLTGTASNLGIYFGLYVENRDEVPRSAAFSAAGDARTDFMDCWFDVAQVPAVAPASLLTQATGQQQPKTERTIRTKRRVQSNQLFWFSQVAIPVSGTVPANYAVNTQWQCSVLLHKGS